METNKNKYDNGKIYKIVDIGYNKCYYGSTVQNLSMRMGDHRKKYRCYKTGSYHYFSVFDLFDEYGVEHCKIELVETYPCTNREELEKREGFYIQNNDCLNKRIAGRSKQEYLEQNKELVVQRRKAYRERNRDKLLEKDRDKYERNRNEILEQRKEYYLNNKDDITKKKKEYYDKLETILCPICGSKFKKCNKKNHEKTKKHLTTLPN